jgi:dipeptidyl aminopeptidase/acylaminoacyl peptidase
MKNIRQDFKRKAMLFIIPIIFMFLSPVCAQDNDNSEIEVFVEQLLKLGSIDVKAPVYGSVKNLKGETFSSTDLLDYDYLNPIKLKPRLNDIITINGVEFEWESENANKENFILAERHTKKDIGQLSYFAAFIDVNRWVEATIEITCPQMFRAYLDGDLLTSKESVDSDDAEKVGSRSKKCKLENGKHLLVVKTIKPSENDADWKLKVGIKGEKKSDVDALHTSISPEQKMDIDHLLNGTSVNSVSVSPDGDLVLVRFSEQDASDGDSKSWSEVRDLNSNRLIQSFRNTHLAGLQWTQKGRKLSYTTSSKDEGSSIWIFDLDNMTEAPLLEGVKDLGGYSWSEDDRFIIYNISEKPEKDKSGLNRLEGMPDRWPWWRSRGSLYKLDVESGFTQRLTYGNQSTNLQDIRHDGNKILFSVDVPDFSERPYSKQYLMEMDLETYNLDTIWEKRFSGSCSYSPNGEYLIVTGSPMTFGDLGVSVGGDAIPNDYDTQAYIYNLSSGDVEPITLSFNPSVKEAMWSKFDENQIYFVASDSTYVRVFRYDLNTRYFERVETGFDVVNDFSIAKNSSTAVYTGSSISTPKYANKINLSTGEFTELANPQKEAYEDVAFGETEDWTFKNYSNVEIDGTIYYPPDFDKDKKYPLIVYYYGGTSPVDRAFGGRYPKNLFAAQGYVVYVLQPSGAVGYGQPFSARHVNNWGITVADEIILGTQLFVETHPFIDSKRVGCMGASYGGFMTMLLQTRTDIFAAAISHAGISSISSYWGEGYWGYLYSSVASANSFPWNNSKLYVNQSPLFNADKIVTPLLLLHGTDDTNVPPGESIQLYTALKLLGKPVELIEVEGQDHHIADYEKRIVWQKTILAWYDKWLKDQPEWWNDLYPERNL